MSMHTIRTLFVSVVVGWLPASSGAAIIFDYVGTDFTQSTVSPLATTDDRITGFVEFASEPVPGTGGILSVASWGFSAGSVELTSGDGDAILSPGFFFEFDLLGGVAAWDFWVTAPIQPPVQFPGAFLQSLLDAGEITPFEFNLLGSLPPFPSPIELSLFTDVLASASLTPQAQSLLGQYVSAHVALGGTSLAGDSILSCASAAGGTDICDGSSSSSDTLLASNLESASVLDDPGSWTRRNPTSGPGPIPMPEPSSLTLFLAAAVAGSMLTRRT